VAVLVTYTMIEPIVAGAFFRALRLGEELHRRGWQVVVCNSGPELTDPKITEARDWLRYLPLGARDPRAACAQFLGLDPDVLVMGESPFEAMRAFFDGARLTGRPLATLDQYYSRALIPDREGVDLVLLYGLRAFWQRDAALPRRCRLVPPFIDRVTPAAELPVPAARPGAPLVTFVAYDEHCLRGGAELLRSLGDRDAAVVSISRDPDAARRLLRDVGGPDRVLALPLQLDPPVFGYLRASSVGIVSNGFIQIMDCLALGCPVVTLSRGGDLGMNDLNIDARFAPYVSLGDSREEQARKLAEWLRTPPIPPALARRLTAERHGAQRSADLVERLATRRHRRPRWSRVPAARKVAAG
jgi:hypothetical protein